MKSEVDKLNIDKLVPIPVHLSKLSDVVKMMLLKMMYTMLSSKILKVKKNGITNVATNATINAKINEVKNT